MARWELRDAQQQFERLIDGAQAEGPQLVTLDGEEVAVVLDIAEYRVISHGGDFKKFLLSFPDGELPIERSKELPREVER